MIRRREGLLDGALIVLVILIVWQGLYAYAGAVALTPPWQTVRYAIGLFGTPSFWGHLRGTLAAFGWSLLISAVLGIALGLWLGAFRFAGDVAEPMLTSLYTIPKVTLYPVILLLFGLGPSAKIAFGVIHGMIPVVLFTLGAVKTIRPVLLRTARAMRLSPMQTARHVLVPAVLPEIASGLRVGFSLCLLGVLIGEMFASQRGIGFLIINGINSHNVRLTTAVTLIVILFAVGANSALLMLDRRLHHSR
ncbi:MAG TPA: ABC transporter permease subunit [Rhodopila sp.]|nr:ABC transporter permease subunit [Rhodopila sp.]